MNSFSRIKNVVESRSGAKSRANNQKKDSDAASRRLENHQGQALAVLAGAGAVLEDTHGLAHRQVWESQEFPAETLEAVRRKYPNEYGSLSDDQIVDKVLSMSPESRDGFVDGVKGKLYEMRKVEELNSGGSIGDLSLEPGQEAELAATGNEGADIIIRNPDGTVAEGLSAKCTEYAGVVRESLQKYPDLSVVAPEEIEASTDVYSGDASEAEMEAELSEQMDGSESLEALEMMEPLGDIAPGIPLLIVAFKHGKPVVAREKSMRHALSDAIPDLTAAAAFTVVGGTLAFLDMGLLSLPVIVIGRKLYKKWKKNRRVRKRVAEVYFQLEKIAQESRRFNHIL
jgi:hypothetical protein